MASTENKGSVKANTCKAGSCPYKIIASLMILLCLLAAILFYLFNYNSKTDDSAVEIFSNAVVLFENNKLDEASKAFDEISSQGNKPYSFLARMYSASILVKKNDFRNAATKLLAIADDASVPSIIRDIATIDAAQVLVDNAKYDEITKILQKFNNPSSPMHYSAVRIIGLAALKAGNIEKAKTIFESIAKDARINTGFIDNSKMILDHMTASGKIK